MTTAKATADASAIDHDAPEPARAHRTVRVRVGTMSGSIDIGIADLVREVRRAHIDSFCVGHFPLMKAARSSDLAWPSRVVGESQVTPELAIGPATPTMMDSLSNNGGGQ